MGNPNMIPSMFFDPRMVYNPQMMYQYQQMQNYQQGILKITIIY